jgi:primosomal protein N' (replication factor Y)
MFFYNILFPVALNKTFTYSSKEEIEIGKRVITPFKNRQKIGIIWGKIDKKPDYETKEIIKVLDNKPIISKDLKKALEFISNYYMSFLGLALKSALPKRVFDKDIPIDFNRETSPIKDIREYHRLNKEQQSIYESIEKDKFSVNLIFGVTGSGKTEVYMKTIKDVVEKGKKAVVLVPEITLTPQYIEVFSKRFHKESISIIHSRLTPKKKFDNWLNFINGKTRILIGTRSAVFVDFKNVGIVIVDEENDESYKQENEPRYNAKDMAIYRAKQHNIPVILCSATPTLETYYKAINKKFKMFRLTKRIKNIPLPKVEIVETLKNEILSQRTIEEIDKALQNNKTVAILANRRGFSNYIVCGDCGYLFLCPNCSVSLTYHKQTNNLKCHWCETSYDIPKVCPKCQSHNILTRGVGSQQVEELIKTIYKGKEVERFDRDSVLTKKGFEGIINKLKNGSIDILIGTQILSKGHDISKIGLVVISSLEELFSIPDFRAKEKALSLIIQTAGRSGRQESGNVILQTYSKENDLIDYIKKHDYEEFLKKEIEIRKLFNYPPFSRLIRIIVESKNENKASQTIQTISDAIKNDLTILGPSKCPLFKIRNNYRFHILIKTNDIIKSLNFIRQHTGNFKENVHFDVDPISFF